MSRHAFALVPALALLAACAAPNVDQTATGFDHKTYNSDLNECQGGSAIEAALETTGVVLWGSLVGAYHGLHLGLSESEKAEGMLVGAIIGASVGIGIGAVESVSEFNDEVDDCLRVRGYSVS